MYALTSLVLLFGVTDITYRAELHQRGRIDFHRLAGTWKAVTLTYGGQDITSLFDRSPTFRILGNQAWAGEEKEPLLEASLPPTVDPDFQDPHAIDFEVADTPKPCRAIASFKDGTLTIAVSFRWGFNLFGPQPPVDPSERRPKTFDGKEADTLVIVLKKIR